MCPAVWGSQREGIAVSPSWRRRWDSNPGIEVLQTSALPLGYAASAKIIIGEGSNFQPPGFHRAVRQDPSSDSQPSPIL